MESCYERLIKFIKARSIIINLDGKMFRILSPIQHKILVIELLIILMITYILYSIRNIPYHDITITGNTIYSRLMSSYFLKNKIPHILCRSNNRLTYYQCD